MALTATALCRRQWRHRWRLPAPDVAGRRDGLFTVGGARRIRTERHDRPHEPAVASTKNTKGRTTHVTIRSRSKWRFAPRAAASRRRIGRRRAAAGRHDHAGLCGRQAADRHLAGRLGRHDRHHRRRRAAHRRLCGAGRRRAQGHATCRRAHQRRPPADQEDRAQGLQGRARQAGESGGRRLCRQPEQCGAGAAALHQRQQDRRHDRLDLVGGGGGAQQVRRAREDSLSGGDLRLQRHHRQGLRALLVPPVLLRRDRGQRDRPGAAQDLRQEQEGGVHDAGLHLRPHRHQVDERLSLQERRLDHGDQPGLQARHPGLQPVHRPTSPIRAPSSSSTSTGAATPCCRSSRPSSSA